MSEWSQTTSAPSQHILHEARNTTIGQAVFNNVGRDLIHYNYASNPLWDAIADVGASHNSEIQVERGRCLPGTREAVLELIRVWKASECQQLPVCWLSGAAGVGKSAIALTIAEEWEKDGLVVSFFFFRSDPKRNNPSSLVLSIAHGLITTRPHLAPLVNWRIAADPRVLKARLEDQYNELVLEHLSLPSSRKSPELVIIDGLDECSNGDVQRRVLSIIFSTYQQPFRSPLRFLICSRPESWIREVFDSHIPRSLTRHIKLDDSFQPQYDIKLYLSRQFLEIRGDPKYKDVGFPNPWPSTKDVDLLIEKADGQFIYASIVAMFVKAEYAHPITQLNIILSNISTDSSDPSTHSPFHDLDELYRIVLRANPDRDKLLLPILAVILLSKENISSSPAFIELLLGLPTGMVPLTLRGMHSVLDVRGRDDNIRIYHTSFTDFLLDRTRSKEFFVDKKHQFCSLAQRWLRILQTPSDIPEWARKDLWWHWGQMCSLVETPTQELLSQLNKLHHLGTLIAETAPDLTGSRLRPLFFNFGTIFSWLDSRVNGVVSPHVLHRFETVLRGFDIPRSMLTMGAETTATQTNTAEIATWILGPPFTTDHRTKIMKPSRRSRLPFQKSDSEGPPQYLSADLSLTSKEERLNVATALDLRSAKFCQCFRSQIQTDSVMGTQWYHVDLQPEYLNLVATLFENRGGADAIEDKLLVLLETPLLRLCGPQNSLVSSLREVMIDDKKWGRTKWVDPPLSLKPPNSKTRREKLLSWLELFPSESECERDIAQIKEDIRFSNIKYRFDY
ncbi:hypothetical protein E1B28_005057 [Marasmius oreades]|uniref:NACHT domain-containing protein n=1 Tax=Marasmius oreades TaxID=181124 RepID=A0A9P8ADL9_9AGAR|nr:uncharacterized protein E1B28_005057 [Marasmius oreades]KAG7097737.1 hypothetical protein E1B28_005057 [Marasmius oreades]